ncbi:MAG: glycosyltransferase [Cyanobacteria bacterium RM1_2_2]|nr:glycosyltransferase [Cyanobacteria bacterium RM1_2_2]
MRLIVYSHDAFGLGNIRRMLAICQHLLRAYPKAEILVISGSPALHSLRLPQGLDYIKLPCVGRDETGEVTAKFLDTDIRLAVQLRSDLILSTIKNFNPDLILVDKKPDGLEGELKATLSYLKTHRPNTKLVLLLRDILDAPETTIQKWQRHGYCSTIESMYDQVWVVGMPEIFDVCREYQFPAAVARKVRYCGYIRREPGLQPRTALRQALQIQPDEKFVLVTPGGGADGYQLVDTYLKGLEASTPHSRLKSLIVSGPEMPAAYREQLRQRIEVLPNVILQEFTDDLVSYMDAADVVVSMAGYNTIGEILSLNKRAVVVPRIQPVEEQWIRAERMAKLGLFQTIHPSNLTPQSLMQCIETELETATSTQKAAQIDMNALPRIATYLSRLVDQSTHQSIQQSIHEDIHQEVRETIFNPYAHPIFQIAKGNICSV